MARIQITGKKLIKAKNGLSNQQGPCPKGYIYIDGDCVPDFDPDIEWPLYTKYSTKENEGKDPNDIEYTRGFRDNDYGTMMKPVVVQSNSRKKQVYDKFLLDLGIGKKSLEQWDKAIKNIPFVNFLYKQPKQTVYQQDYDPNADWNNISSKMDEYWSSQMADPKLKEVVLRDPYAYQSLRLEAFRKAGASDKLIARKACDTFLGFEWDPQLQTCVPQWMSGEEAAKEGRPGFLKKQDVFRTINPQIWQDVIAPAIADRSLSNHNKVFWNMTPERCHGTDCLKHRMMKGEDYKDFPEQSYHFMQGIAPNKYMGKKDDPQGWKDLPFYSYETVTPDADRYGTVGPGGIFDFSHKDGNYTLRDWVYAGDDVKKEIALGLAGGQGGFQQDDSSITAALERINREGLKGINPELQEHDIIPQGYFDQNHSTGQFQTLAKNAIEASPGYNPQYSWKKQGEHLLKQYNDENKFNRWYNTQMMGLNLSNKGINLGGDKQGPQGGPLKFIQDISSSTMNDILTGVKFAQRHPSTIIPFIPGTLNGGWDNNTPIYGTNIPMNSLKGKYLQYQIHDTPDLGLLGLGHTPYLLNSAEGAATNLQNLVKHPSWANLGRTGLGLAMTGWDAFLSTPIINEFGLTTKAATKGGAKAVTKEGAKFSLREPEKYLNEVLSPFTRENLTNSLKTFAKDFKAKPFLQQVKTPFTIAGNVLHKGYFDPLTKATAAPSRIFGRSIPKTAWGFRAGDEMYHRMFNTSPFQFVPSPIPEYLMTPEQKTSYNLQKSIGIKNPQVNTSQPAKTYQAPQGYTVVNQQTGEVAPTYTYPSAYKKFSDTTYNVNVGGINYTFDLKNADDKDAFSYLLEQGGKDKTFNPKTYNPKTGQFHINIPKESQKNFQDFFSPFQKNINNK